MNLEIDSDVLAGLISSELKRVYISIKEQYDSKVHQRMFDINEEVDRMKIKRFLKSIKRVHDYYSIYEINEYPHNKGLYK